MSDIPTELRDEAYDAFAAAFAQRAPAPSALITGDPLPGPTGGGGEGEPDSPPADPPPVTEPVAPEPIPAPEPPPTPDAPPPAEQPESFLVNGQEYTRDQVEQYLNIVNRLAALPNDQRAAIDYLVETGHFPEAPRTGPLPQTPSDVQYMEPDSQEEYLDPRAASDIKALRQQIADLQASTSQLAQQSNQTDMERINGIVTQAMIDYQTSTGLTDAEVNLLANEAARLQIGPALLESHRGDYHASTLEALEVAQYRLPQFRDKAIAAQVKAQVDASLLEAQSHDSRKAKAGALAGSPSGSVPRDTPAPRPSNRQEQLEAIAATIREAQSNGVPS